MPNRVYVLGAGVNQEICFDNNGESYHPPMSRDFFKVALCMERYICDYYDWNCKPLSEHIYKYWRKDKEDLIKNGLDLEDCFTLLQLQRWTIRVDTILLSTHRLNPEI